MREYLQKNNSSSNLCYYNTWINIRILRKEERIYYNKDTIAIESSAWNLNILIVSLKKNNILEFNFPYTNPLNPIKIKEHQQDSIDKIISQIFLLLTDKELDYIYCKGPGLAPSLSSVVYLYDKLAAFYKITSYPLFHGLSHLSEVLANNSEKKNFLFCYLSGGSTQFILKREKEQYRILSETLDITAGNLLDKLARIKYNKKPYELNPSVEEILEHIEDTKKYCATFSWYFNLSGIEGIMTSWSYSQLLSFIVNLLLRTIQMVKEKVVYFSGGVFNSCGMRETLKRLCPEGYLFFFEESNSDKAFMHVLNRFLNQTPPSSIVDYQPKLRIVDDYTPIENDNSFSLPLTLDSFLHYFSLLSNISRRELIFYLGKNLHKKQERRYYKVLCYRRHLPIK